MILHLLLLICILLADPIRGVSITSEDQNGEKNAEPDNEKGDEPENLVTNHLSEAELIKLATQFYFQTKYKESIQCYNKAIEMNSSDMTYYYKRALTFMKLSIYDKAIEDFRLLLSHNIDTNELLLMALLNAGETEEASKIMSKIKESRLSSLGYQLMKEKKLHAALLCYEELIGRHTDYSKAGYYHPSRAKINLMLKNYDDALSDYKYMLSLDPNDEDYRTDYINALTYVGKVDEAIQEAHLAGKYGLTSLARHFFDEGKFEEYLRCCNKAIETKQNVAHAHYLRGGYYKEKKQIDRAIEDYREAIAKEPEIETYRFTLISTLLDEKKVDEAIREMGNLKTRDLLNLSEQLSKIDKSEYSRICCEEALKRPLEPSSTVHELRGRCERKLGRLQEAITSYELACMEDDWNRKDIIFLEYAEVLLESGQIDAARLVIKNRIKYERLYTEDFRVRFNKVLKKVENEEVKAEKAENSVTTAT